MLACLCERVSDLPASISEQHEVALIDFAVGLSRQQPKVVLREGLEPDDCIHKKSKKADSSEGPENP